MRRPPAPGSAARENTTAAPRAEPPSPAGSAGSAVRTGMLRERRHRCPPPRPHPHPPGASRPGPRSPPAEPGDTPRLPPSILSGRPPIPAGPGTDLQAGGAAASAATAPGAGAAAGGEGRALTWCWAGAGGGLSAFVPQTSRWRRGAWPALLAPARPALSPASLLAGRAPPRADWAPPAPLLLGEQGRGVGRGGCCVPPHSRPGPAPSPSTGPWGQATPPGLPAGPASAPLREHREQPPPERAALGSRRWPQARRQHPGTGRLGPVPFTCLRVLWIPLLQAAAALDTALSNFSSGPA